MTDVAVRAPRAGEVQAITDLFNDISIAAFGVPDTTPAEIELWFTSPEVDPERDIRVAAAPDGTLVGYGDVSDDGGTGTRLWLDIREREGAGVAGQLLDALMPRARHYAAGAAEGAHVLIRGYAPSGERTLAAMYADRGFVPVRHSYRMEVDLADEPPEPEWPEGITVRTFAGESEERDVYDTVNEGFADMWEHVANPFEEWRHFMTGAPDFDPSLWFLALEGEEIAGVCLCRSREPGDEAVGWIRVLAVRPAWRRRGIGQALLRHAFHEFRARGRPRAGLGVDAESTTGAIELYARAGMRVVREATIYEQELRAPG